MKSPEKSPERECHSPASDDFQEFESYQPAPQTTSSVSAPQKIPVTSSTTHTDSITHSSTSDSLTDVPVKNFTPSMTSSGYDSQAVSTHTLSSEDSSSLRSMSIEEVQDEMAARNKSIEKSDSSSSEHEESRNNKSADKAEDEQFVMETSANSLSLQNQGQNPCEGQSDDKGHIKKEDAKSVEPPNDLPIEKMVVENTADDHGETVMENILSPMDMDVPTDISPPLLVPTMSTDKPAEQNQTSESSAVVVSSSEQAQEQKQDSVNQSDVSSHNADSLSAESAAPCESSVNNDCQLTTVNNSVNGEESNTNVDSKMTSSSSSNKNEAVVDVYSENAMEELEKLGDEENLQVNDSSSRKKILNKNNSDVKVMNKDKRKQDKSHPEEHDKFDEKPKRNNSFNDKLRRRSIDDKEKQMRKSSSIDDVSKTEVKLRKTANFDATRSMSLKKMRPGEKGGKTAPSPVRATYRPMSMPVEMAMALTSGELEITGSGDENNSGGCKVW